MSPHPPLPTPYLLLLFSESVPSCLGALAFLRALNSLAKSERPSCFFMVASRSQMATRETLGAVFFRTPRVRSLFMTAGLFSSTTPRPSVLRLSLSVL